MQQRSNKIHFAVKCGYHMTWAMFTRATDRRKFIQSIPNNHIPDTGVLDQFILISIQIAHSNIVCIVP